MKFPSFARLHAWLGIPASQTSHREKLLSGTGALLGISGTYFLSQLFLGQEAAVILTTSMGSSAVLLFALPHGPQSQPWALFASHFVSAAIGVACARHVASLPLAAGLAVGLSVTAMYYLRCIHPPGGATALAAVIGGPGISRMGYDFVFTPVLLNTVWLFLIALAFNYPFAWRRYPAALVPRPAKEAQAAVPLIRHEDFVYALSQLDAIVDVSEEDLLRIYALATGRAASRPPLEIRAGRAYSNGGMGEAWEVRQVVEVSPGGDSGQGQVAYVVVAGSRQGQRGVMPLDEFARWAGDEVVRHGQGWRRAD